MQLSLNAIFENLNINNARLFTFENKKQFFSGINILTHKSNESMKSDLIYADLSGIINNTSPILKNNFYIIYENQYDSFFMYNFYGIVIPDTACMNDIFNEINDIFQRFNEWDTAMNLAIIQNRPLCEIFNLGNMVTRDTIYLTDLSLKMLATTTPSLMDDVSAIWRFQITYGYMPMHIVKALIETGELNKINSHRHAFNYLTNCFNLPYTCRNIFFNNDLQGHLFIVNIYAKPNETNLEIAEHMGELLSEYIVKSGLLSHGNGLFHEHFMIDILEQKLTDKDLINEQLTYFNWNLEGCYYLCILENCKSSEISSRYITNFLEGNQLYNCKAFEYHKNVVILLAIPENEHSEDKIINMMKTVTEVFDFRGSISKQFKNLLNMHTYYKQALNILNICKAMKDKGRIFHNNDYGLYTFIKNMLSEHTAYEICHQSVLDLYEMDQSQGTDYINTLFYYLVNDRNILKSSKALFIHRNTMNYRIEKLRTFINIDNVDDEVREYILLSLYIIRYLQKIH